MIELILHEKLTHDRQQFPPIGPRRQTFAAKSSGNKHKLPQYRLQVCPWNLNQHIVGMISLRNNSVRYLRQTKDWIWIKSLNFAYWEKADSRQTHKSHNFLRFFESFSACSISGISNFVLNRFDFIEIANKYLWIGVFRLSPTVHSFVATRTEELFFHWFETQRLFIEFQMKWRFKMESKWKKNTMDIYFVVQWEK